MTAVQYVPYLLSVTDKVMIRINAATPQITDVIIAAFFFVAIVQ